MLRANHLVSMHTAFSVQQLHGRSSFSRQSEVSAETAGHRRLGECDWTNNGVATHSNHLHDCHCNLRRHILLSPTERERQGASFECPKRQSVVGGRKLAPEPGHPKLLPVVLTSPATIGSRYVYVSTDPPARESSSPGANRVPQGLPLQVGTHRGTPICAHYALCCCLLSLAFVMRRVKNNGRSLIKSGLNVPR